MTRTAHDLLTIPRSLFGHPSPLNPQAVPPPPPEQATNFNRDCWSIRPGPQCPNPHLTRHLVTMGGPPFSSQSTLYHLPPRVTALLPMCSSPTTPIAHPCPLVVVSFNPLPIHWCRSPYRTKWLPTVTPPTPVPRYL